MQTYLKKTFACKLLRIPSPDLNIQIVVYLNYLCSDPLFCEEHVADLYIIKHSVSRKNPKQSKMYVFEF